MLGGQAELKFEDKAINLERQKRKAQYEAEILRRKIEADNQRTKDIAEAKRQLLMERQVREGKNRQGEERRGGGGGGGVKKPPRNVRER